MSFLLTYRHLDESVYLWTRAERPGSQHIVKRPGSQQTVEKKRIATYGYLDADSQMHLGEKESEMEGNSEAR